MYSYSVVKNNEGELNAVLLELARNIMGKVSSKGVRIKQDASRCHIKDFISKTLVQPDQPFDPPSLPLKEEVPSSIRSIDAFGQLFSHLLLEVVQPNVVMPESTEISCAKAEKHFENYSSSEPRNVDVETESSESDLESEAEVSFDDQLPALPDVYDKLKDFTNCKLNNLSTDRPQFLHQSDPQDSRQTKQYEDIKLKNLKSPKNKVVEFKNSSDDGDSRMYQIEYKAKGNRQHTNGLSLTDRKVKGRKSFMRRHQKEIGRQQVSRKNLGMFKADGSRPTDATTSDDEVIFSH
ncbi:unnamed protein product [Protopolystoma xenopodis]|uniref:Uncharacterized protein n=1 Tax=Protopolystoma xenopodis TaxID=117903 RepID=A0A3S5A6S2_9PLAT|nr:unnamed protein product [Protopolystoma xenopodis]